MPATSGPPAPHAGHRRPGSAVRASAGRGPGAAPPLGDRRGLTAAGAFLLLLLLTTLGALLDALVSRHQLWLLFTIGFVLSAGLGAQRVHREDLGTSVLLPPIAYALVVAGASLFSPRSGSSGLRQHALDASRALVLHAPILLGGTLLAAVVAAFRLASRRHPGH